MPLGCPKNGHTLGAHILLEFNLKGKSRGQKLLGLVVKLINACNVRDIYRLCGGETCVPNGGEQEKGLEGFGELDQSCKIFDLVTQMGSSQDELRAKRGAQFDNGVPMLDCHPLLFVDQWAELL